VRSASNFRAKQFILLGVPGPEEGETTFLRYLFAVDSAQYFRRLEYSSKWLRDPKLSHYISWTTNRLTCQILSNFL